MGDSNREFVTCLNCEKVIASFKKDEDKMEPSAEECYATGNVPVPNCGWFCSQKCAIEFEQSHGVKFGRTIDGMIDYYRKENLSK
jgi:hypothetical protein